jgi:hypothetical protein
MMRTEFDNVTNSSSSMAMDPNDRLSFTLLPNATAIFPYNQSAKKPEYNRVDFFVIR